MRSTSLAFPGTGDLLGQYASLIIARKTLVCQSTFCDDLTGSNVFSLLFIFYRSVTLKRVGITFEGVTKTGNISPTGHVERKENQIFVTFKYLAFMPSFFKRQ
jgi:hypothetical protein